MSESRARPIIVIKKKSSHAGHHGGAWKVAYADFVTAMMSLFIVLWLLNSTPQVKKAIAGYFNDPRGTSRMMGTEMLGSGASVTIDDTNVKKLAEAIKKAIVKQKELDKLADQVELKMTDEGLRIELIDGKNGSFFESGSPKITDNGIQLLTTIAGQLKTLPNHLLIEGHTDAKVFAGANGYSNWELSSDRANSARQLMQADGVRQDQVAQVRGYADQSLRVPNDPLDASNRRISIVVQFIAAPEGTTGPEILNAEGGDEKEGKTEGTGEKSSEGGKAKPRALEKRPQVPAAPPPPVPVEAKPSAGKIELPSKPTGAAAGVRPAAKPLTGKIDLPPKPAGGKPSGSLPSGKVSDKLGTQLNQLRQIKQADASHGK